MASRFWLAALLVLALLGAQAVGLAHGAPLSANGQGAALSHHDEGGADEGAHEACALCLALLQAKTFAPTPLGADPAPWTDGPAARVRAAEGPGPRSPTRTPEGPRAPPHVV